MHATIQTDATVGATAQTDAIMHATMHYGLMPCSDCAASCEYEGNVIIVYGPHTVSNKMRAGCSGIVINYDFGKQCVCCSLSCL